MMNELFHDRVFEMIKWQNGASTMSALMSYSNIILFMVPWPFISPTSNVSLLLPDVRSIDSDLLLAKINSQIRELHYQYQTLTSMISALKQWLFGNWTMDFILVYELEWHSLFQNVSCYEKKQNEQHLNFVIHETHGPAGSWNRKQLHCYPQVYICSTTEIWPVMACSHNSMTVAWPLEVTNENFYKLNNDHMVTARWFMGLFCKTELRAQPCTQSWLEWDNMACR